MKRNAFTLVELLIVIFILALLSGMTAVTVSGVTNTAKVSRTEGIISVINDVLLTKYESYKTRPLPVAVPAPLNTALKLEIRPREAARIRLLMIRDLMRMEMPDRKIDVVDNPMTISGAAFPVIFNTGTNQYEVQGTPVKRTIGWYLGGKDVPAPMQAYRDRIPPNDNATDPPFSKWTREWESAEALYLIVSTTFMDGLPAIEAIPSGNIGDVDGDGMNEILDAWGNPIGFIRWPADYVDRLTVDTNADSLFDDVEAKRVDDELDPFKVDFGFIDSNAPAVTSHWNRLKPFSLKPLVVSAGADGIFDLRFGYGTSQDGSDDIRFSQMTWPDTVMGGESAGHQSVYRYIDPYQRYSGFPQRLGGYVDEENDGDEQRADNITNLSLELSI